MMIQNRSLKFSTRLEYLLFLGYFALSVLTLIFFIWSIAVPLADSALFQGIVTVGSKRQTIAHVEGGKIDKIYVKIGDIVEVGQPLLKIDDKLLQSELRALKIQRFARYARMDRLNSERRGTEIPEFRDQLIYRAESDPIVKELIEGETRNFETRLQSARAKTALLDHQIKKSSDQKRNLELQIDSIDRQITIVQQQARGADELFNSGYGTKSRAKALQRDVESLITQRLNIESQIEEINGIINDAKLKKDSDFAENANQIEESSIEITEEIATINERINTLNQKIKDATILSDINGIIVDLEFTSSRDIIVPASPIMEIVPQSSTLMIEASVAPRNIDGINEGIDVEVRFPAFAQNDTPKVEGKVSLVSPDIIHDGKNPHYRLHVAIANWTKLNDDLNVIPGMPAEIIIKKRNRTLFDYLTSPILDHISRAIS